MEESIQLAIDAGVAFDLCFEEAPGSAEKFHVMKNIMVKMQQVGDCSRMSEKFLGMYLRDRFKLSALVKKGRDRWGQFYTGLCLRCDHMTM